MLECRIPPLAQVLICAAAMWGLARWIPGGQFFRPEWLAPLCALSGAFVSSLGVWEFRQARTTVDPRSPGRTERLVVRGVYHFSRNPMYLGFLLILVGWGLYLGNALALVVPPVFVVYMNRFQIRPEERYMQQKFGAEFTQYCGKVRRWI